METMGSHLELRRDGLIVVAVLQDRSPSDEDVEGIREEFQRLLDDQDRLRPQLDYIGTGNPAP